MLLTIPLARFTDHLIAQREGASGPRHERDSFVDVEHVWKRFGDNQVLRDVSLKVGLHDVVCLIGASGSGKSTLLRCINLLETIDAGSITSTGRTSPPKPTSTSCASRSGSSSSRTTCSRT